MIEEMEKRGNITFSEQELDHKSIEKSIREQIKRPLFSRALPSIARHSYLRSSLQSSLVSEQDNERTKTKDVKHLTAKVGSKFIKPSMHPSSTSIFEDLDQADSTKLTFNVPAGVAGDAAQKTRRKKTKSQSINKPNSQKSTANLVKELLEKHVPDYKERYPYFQVDQPKSETSEPLEQ